MMAISQNSPVCHLELDSGSYLQSLKKYLFSPQHIFPIVVFRIFFGLSMCYSTIRFWYKGWIETLYLQPSFHFTYYGFEWVKVLPENVMYVLFLVLILSSICISLGLFYRINTILFFLVFTYIELIDKTLYLNHYYFISVVSFYLIFTPAHTAYSLDSYLKIVNPQKHISHFFIWVIKIQLSLVYFYAGIAKLNADWLFEALPLKLWLPARGHLPIIGAFLEIPITAYIFSWFGAIYDLSIPFLLWRRKTRLVAYVLVIIFHAITGLIFQIGVFPLIMIFSTIIFFDIQNYKRIFSRFSTARFYLPLSPPIRRGVRRTGWSVPILFTLLFIQIIFPLRHFFLTQNMGWDETGFRYSWNVMRAEKTGYCEFICVDPTTQKKWTVFPIQHLTMQQEKQMSFQPDMILAFAHHLEKMYHKNIKVYAHVKVSMNGRKSRDFINSNIDLTEEKDNVFGKYNWVLK